MGKDFRTLPKENATAIEAGLWGEPMGPVWMVGSWQGGWVDEGVGKVVGKRWFSLIPFFGVVGYCHHRNAACM